ncbi:MAG: hypothetical protein QOD67_2549 [Caballeronia sp.]|nr:hypothetical protein [Caballeronia sp.]
MVVATAALLRTRPGGQLRNVSRGHRCILCHNFRAASIHLLLFNGVRRPASSRNPETLVSPS